ncbi:MAG: PAS domain S-box protein [Alphaproteobacteria bacterium]|jgi:two-component system cell cycle sensor histidine kinase PleC|nr:PAS domain S-box protein [Alphaproteobacteria bacterium]
MEALGALARLVAGSGNQASASWQRFAATLAAALPAGLCCIWQAERNGRAYKRLACWDGANTRRCAIEGSVEPEAGRPAAPLDLPSGPIAPADMAAGEVWADADSLEVLIRREGRLIGAVRVSGLPDTAGRDRDAIRFFLCAAADIAALALARSPARGKDGADSTAENAAFAAEKQRLDDLFSAVSEFIWEADGDGRLTFVTPRVSDILGFTPEQLLGQSLFDLLANGDRAALRDRYDAAMAAGTGLVATEHRCRTRDGSVVWLRLSGVPLSDANGAPAGMRGAALDITESHQARLSLMQSERRLQEAERIARLGYWEVLTQGGAGYWSDVLNEIWGRAPAAPPPDLDTFMQMIHPDDRAAVLKAIRSPQANKHLEFRICRGDGAIRELVSDFRADVDERGVVVRSYGTAQDVTEHRRAERERAASEHRYRLLADNANDLITLLSSEMTVRYASPSIGRLLGFGPEEMVGVNLYRLVNPLDLTTMRQAHARLQDGANQSSVTCRMRHKDGHWVWVETTSNRVTESEEDAGAATFVAVSRDISERVQYEQDLEEERRRIEGQAVSLAEAAEKLQAARLEAEQARRAAEDANRAKSQFLATMSHELRTPLNAIIGFAEVIKEMHFGADAQDRYVDYAQDIHQSGQHLLDLINDILDIAKIEAGKLKISPEVLSLKPILQGCMRLFSTRANAKDLTLQCKTTPAEATLYADERAIKQILFNLLSNAVKFTLRGGHITVRACADDDGSVEIAVSDTGIGIPADHIERVMQPFEQFENRYDQMREGTGLGLSLVKALAEVHGGTVAIDSRVEVGTTVTVRFPADREWQPRERSQVSA